MDKRTYHRVGLLLLAAFLAAGTPATASAADRWDVAKTAEALLAATDSERDAKLEAAAAGRWNPWLLAAWLRAGGATKPVLARYAALVASKAAGLGAHVAAATPGPSTKAQLSAVEAALAQLEADRPEACLAALAKVKWPAGAATVAAAAGAMLEARAYAALPALERCATAALRAGAAAMTIGWTELAGEAYFLGLEMAHGAGMLEQARLCALGLLGVREAEGDTEAIANAHQDLGGIDYRRGDFSGALRHLEEALALYRTRGSAADAAEVRSLRCVVYAHIGELRRALEDVRQLMAEESVFAGPAPLAEFLSNAAVVYTELGDPAKAEELLQRTLATSRAAKDTAREAVALGNLGRVHSMEERWEDAIGAFQSALGIFEKEGYALNAALGRLAIADTYLQRARSAMQAAEGLPKKQRVPVVIAARKECEAARKLVDEALVVSTSAGATGATAFVRQTRCQILLTLGELEALKERFQAVCDEARRLRLWTAVVSGSTGLASVHIARHEWKDAIRVARSAVQQLAQGYGGLPDADIARSRSFRADVYDLGVRSAAAVGDVNDVHFFLESARAAALLRGLGGRAAALRATVPSDVQADLSTKTRAKAAAMTAYYESLNGDSRKDQGAKRKAYRAARDAEIEVFRKIEALERASAAHLIPPRIETLDDVRPKLTPRGPGAVPTVYLAFNLQARDGWCLIVDAHGQRLVRYGPEHVLAMHAALQELVAERHGEIDAEVLSALRTHLLDPLELPPGKSVYLISPDRELTYVPFSALLPDEVAYAFVPSATTYLMLREQAPKRGRGTVGIGDPDYDRMVDRKTFERRGASLLRRLPLSRDEIVAVTKGTHDVRLLGPKATEEGLTAALQSKGPNWRWRAVHIACHGLVDVELPALCALALTPSTREDGYLTAAELMRMPIRADLAVLSACETGRGRFVRGEGMMGLARAFMYAGAPRVLASLWKVDDKATGVLMKAFHEAWSAGRPPAEALRQAQAQVRDHVELSKGAGGRTVRTYPWKEPAYWAAWVLWGLPN